MEQGCEQLVFFDPHNATAPYARPYFAVRSFDDVAHIALGHATIWIEGKVKEIVAVEALQTTQRTYPHIPFAVYEYGENIVGQQPVLGGKVIEVLALLGNQTQGKEAANSIAHPSLT